MALNFATLTILQLLRNKGNFKHNVKILRGEIDGKIIPVRRSKINRGNEDYLPCTLCHGFYKRDELWRHCKNLCPMNKEERKEGETELKMSVTASSKLFLCAATKSKKSLSEYVSKFKVLIKK